MSCLQVYGQIGAETSPICLKEIAASTTATGRRSLLFARDYIAKTYGAVPVYGDSVAAYTPLVIRTPWASVEVITIEHLIELSGGCWEDRLDGKQISRLEGFAVWSDEGWTEIQQIVRHKMSRDKKLLRVVTHTGLVDVTDDHSLLTCSKEKISPKDVCVGIRLLHNPLPNHINQELCGVAASDADFEEVFDALRNTTCDKAYAVNIDQKNHTTCARIVCLAKSLGFSVCIDERRDKPDVLRLTMTRGVQRKDPVVVKKIYELQQGTGFVYDLTTANHHFAAGIGDLIVHNTDSVFMRFDCRRPDGTKMRGLEAVQESMRLSLKASKEVTQRLPAPNDLAFEKVIYPFLLLSKKRYVGGYYEDLEQTKPKIKHMGVVLKRRDNAPIVKNFYAGVVDILLRYVDTPEFQQYLSENPEVNVRDALIKRAVKLIQGETKKLLEGKFPSDKFIVSKSLKGEYKNPDSIAHRTLADRANERGTDNFQSNDRVAYVYVVTKPVKGQKMLQGEKVETPQYAKDHKLKLDYKHYLTNQIQKPVSQIFALAVEALPGFDKNKHPALWDSIEDPKKREKKRMDIAAKLLFDALVIEYENKLNGVRKVTDFFAAK